MSAVGQQRPFFVILPEGPLSGVKRTKIRPGIVISNYRFRPQAALAMALENGGRLASVALAIESATTIAQQAATVSLKVRYRHGHAP